MNWWASLLARLFPPTQELTIVEWKRQAWGPPKNEKDLARVGPPRLFTGLDLPRENRRWR
jgi:hypothetical protein